MKRLRLSICVILFLAFLPSTFLAYGKDEFKSKKWPKDWSSADACNLTVGGYCVPRQLLDRFDPSKGLTNPFKGLGDFDIIVAYQKDISDRLKKGAAGSAEKRLECTLKLNDSQRKVILEWQEFAYRAFNPVAREAAKGDSYNAAPAHPRSPMTETELYQAYGRYLAKQKIAQQRRELASQKHAADMAVLKTLEDGLLKPSFRRNCENYNKIAEQFDRIGMRDKAEDIYRKVLNECDEFRGPFTEAQISLQALLRRQ